MSAVVFDLDGTLIDSYGAIVESLNHARRGFGLAPLDERSVRPVVGLGLETLVAELVDKGEIPRGVALFREHYARVFADRTLPLPRVSETLTSLVERGYRLGVASNKPTRFSLPILQQLGWESRFQAVQGPDSCGATKPDPALLRHCLGQLGVSPEAALYVGDMGLDVESAARAGVAVVLVRGGSSSDADLQRTGQRVLRSVEELLEVLPLRASGATAQGPRSRGGR